MKDTFFKSTLILIIGGACIKALGMFIKIIMSRIVGLDGMSLYMLVFPTFSLFMSISQLGLPTAISKIIAEDRHNNKNLLLSIIPIMFLYNIFLIVILFLIAPILTSFLNDKRALYPIMSIAIVLPFDSLSSVLRGYFFGKQKMFPHIISLLTEQLVRLSLIILFVPNMTSKGIVEVVSFLIGINMISELCSSIVLILFIKNKKIKISDFFINRKEVRGVFSIAIPTTFSRLIGSISYFLEPIIITYSLINQGYNSNFIIREYGLIEAYVLPLLLIPSFLTNALSSAIIPDISKKYANKDFKGIKRRIKQVLGITISIGLLASILLFTNPSFFLDLIYNVNNGSNYIKILSLFFIILYIESTLESILQAIGKAKKIMVYNFISTLIKLFSIYIFSYLKIGLFNLIYAIIISIIVTTFLYTREIYISLYKKRTY